MTDRIDIVTARGRLDSNTCSALESDIRDRVEGGARRLLLDFSDLHYISSAGLRVILVAAKEIEAVQGRMAIVSANWQVDRILDVSGFRSFLDVQTDLAAAEESLRRSP